MTKAILFPGQGAQKVGMGSDFVAAHPRAKELFDRADEVLGYSLSKIVFEGPDEILTLTRHCQPAIYVTSAAIASVLVESGRIGRADITMTAGLSLGEYTALWWAGAYSFEDGLRLVALRGEHMQAASDAPPSGMTSLLGATVESARALADAARGEEVLSVANILSPGQIVLSGSKAALERVPALVKEFGIKRAIPLNVAGAFHSALMRPAAEKLIEALARTEIKRASIPVVSNVTGRPMSEPDEIRSRLGAQVTEPVLWQQSMESMIAAGIDTVVEPGPGRVLSGLLKKIDPAKSAINVETVAELNG